LLTLFSIPKPFTGPTGEAQRIALASWTALAGVEVVLVGDEEGIAEAATAAGARHIDTVARSAGGTPRLDDAFARVDEIAQYRLRCFVNADVVLFDDLPLAVAKVADRWPGEFLAVGETRDLAVTPNESADALRARALRDGVRRGAGAVDYFVFPAELFRDLPPFLVGRAGFDNWMLWHARSSGYPLVDLTDAVIAVHQSHGYGHLAGGKTEAYLGDEAAVNHALVGGKSHLYSMRDASHRLRHGRFEPNPWAIGRIGDRVRRARWKLGLDRSP
jgi:hypothetical protein